MANKSGMQVLFFGSKARTGFGSKVAGPKMTRYMGQELRKRIVPEIQAGYDKMTEDWSEKPTPTIKVGQRKDVGNYVEVRFQDNTNANKKWLLVDTQGRKGGATIKRKPKFVEPAPGGTFKIGGFKKQKLSVNAEFVPVFEYKKKGEIVQARGEEGRPPLHFKSQYSAKTTPGGGFGGPGEKSEPWVTKMEVKQGAVQPRFLSRENVLTALAGRSSRLSGIITPWFSDSGPTRAAYRAAFFRVTGRRI